ncbi:hypothetical protein [Arthrobacter sp. D1-17]
MKILQEKWFVAVRMGWTGLADDGVVSVDGQGVAGDHEGGPMVTSPAGSRSLDVKPLPVTVQYR